MTKTRTHSTAVPTFTRATTLIPFAKAFASHGGDAPGVIARHRLPPDCMADPGLLIEASACYAAIEEMAEALGDPHFAAMIAMRAADRGTPSLRDAARGASTLGDFLCRAVTEVASQFDNVRYSVLVSAEVAHFDVRRNASVATRLTQIDAIGVCFFVSVMRRGLREAFNARRIVVTVPSIDGIPEGFLPASSVVVAPVDGLRISFPPQWMSQPFSLGWTMPAASRGEFGDDHVDAPFLAFLRRTLEDTIGDAALSLGQFAAICGQHPRRIQRILAARGTTYRAMRDAVRRRIATDLVANSRLPIAAIASRVGFSGPAAFDRAFRTWLGVTPSGFRTAAPRPVSLAGADRVAPFSMPRDRAG